ncbi:MAG: regulatory protein RecX [Gammaproteobacteria bacterium]
MDYLARREHGVLELTRKLIARGFDADPVEAAVNTLVADGLLSDSRFAEAFVHFRFQKGSGPQKIHAELRQRGIDDDLISASLESVSEQWLTRVRDVREKKYGAEPPRDFRERNRQMRFLQQRGFTSEQIYSVFKDE